MNKNFLELINKHQKDKKNLCMATLVQITGSAPQEVGAKILIDENGYLAGTVGGGKIEARVISHSKKILNSKEKFDYQNWNLQKDIGMTCGGVVSFFFEKIESRPSWELAIFGAGHIAQELVRILLKLDCTLTCIDPRKEWLDKLPEHYNLNKIQKEQMQEAIPELREGTFIASMTMGHAFDLPILEAAILHNKFPYIGVIGSGKKALVLKNDLKKRGLEKEAIDKIYCPIGEPLGKNEPMEIAISIAVQFIKKRDEFLKAN